jgi:hypothetical protein
MSFGLGTPGLTASNYILNIVELQNTVTSAGGVSPFNALSNQVAQIQQMVNFGTKTVAADTLSAFTTGGTIQVVSPLNLSSVTITANGQTVIGGGATTLGSTSTFLTVTGGGLSFIQGGNVSTFTILSTGDAVFGSTVTAANFITASDARLKTDIQPIVEYETILSSIRGVFYRWKDDGQQDVGVIAQEVARELPEAVETDRRGYMGVAYHKLVPVLIEAVKSLQRRVTVLESAVAKGL